MNGRPCHFCIVPPSRIMDVPRTSTPTAAMLGYKTPAHATVDASRLRPCAIYCRRRVRAKPSLLN
eukprot:10677940-Lingulodinium_polyedra.AAC.1